MYSHPSGFKGEGVGLHLDAALELVTLTCALRVRGAADRAPPRRLEADRVDEGSRLEPAGNTRARSPLHEGVRHACQWAGGREENEAGGVVVERGRGRAVGKEAQWCA